MINYVYATKIYSVGNIGSYGKDIEDGMTYEDLVSFMDIPNNPLTPDSKFCPDERETYIPEESDEG